MKSSWMSYGGKGKANKSGTFIDEESMLSFDNCTHRSEDLEFLCALMKKHGSDALLESTLVLR